MNAKQAKKLRKVLLNKTPEVLMLINKHYESKTKEIQTPQAVWRLFKELYKNGKVPANLLR